jgi:hypothetical protein
VEIIGSRIQRKVIIAGETPKLMVSAKLSSSAPNGENALRSLADRPSIISKQAAARIQKTAFCQLPSSAKRIPVKPEHKPIVVNILGNNLGSDILRFTSLLTFLFI